MLRTLAEVFGIFAVSMILLFVFYSLTTKKANGIAVIQGEGFVLMGVGVLYILCRAILTRLGR
jgi:hypothetical protein